jgi:hypothetical protein
MRCRGSHRSPDLIRRTRAMLLSCGDALVDFLPVKSADGRDATVPVVGGSCLNIELRRRCRSSSRAVRTSLMRPRPSAPPVPPPGPWQQFRQIVHLGLPRHDLFEHIGEVGLRIEFSQVGQALSNRRRAGSARAARCSNRSSRRLADDLLWLVDGRTPGARLVVLYVRLTSARGLSVAKSLSSLSNPLSGW